MTNNVSREKLIILFEGSLKILLEHTEELQKIYSISDEKTREKLLPLVNNINTGLELLLEKSKDTQ